MRTNANLTIYNKYILNGSEKYQRTQIGALGSFSVEWENRKASNVIKSGLLAADSVVVYITFAQGSNHLNPKAWLALTTKTGKWTLAVGDVIVKGLVTDEIHDAIVGPPAVPAFTMTNLKALYDDVVTIKSVDTFDMGSLALQHWKVSAQ
jgi:hypothetical protein